MLEGPLDPVLQDDQLQLVAQNPWSQCLILGTEKSCLVKFKPFISDQHELSACTAEESHRYSEGLAMLHAAYPGILHMKELARSSVWWPGFNPEIEKKAEE